MKPRNGNKSDQAHPPIHPIKYTNDLTVGIQFLLDFLFFLNLKKLFKGQRTKSLD